MKPIFFKLLLVFLSLGAITATLSAQSGNETRIKLSTMLEKAGGAGQFPFTNAQGEQVYTDFNPKARAAFSEGAGITITNGVIATTVVDTDDQTAAEVNVTDSGNNYTATNVEAVLAEIASSLAADGDKSATNELISTVSIVGSNFRITEAGTARNMAMSTFLSGNAGNALVLGSDSKFFVPSSAAPSPQRQTFNIATGTSTVSVSGYTLPTSNEAYNVYRNGVLMTLTDDYTRSASDITFVNALVSGERVTVQKLF